MDNKRHKYTQKKQKIQRKRQEIKNKRKREKNIGLLHTHLIFQTKSKKKEMKFYDIFSFLFVLLGK